jgi:hypothetical protein
VTDTISAVAELASQRDPLDVTADLTATLDGEAIKIESFADEMFVNLPSVGTARRLWAYHGDDAGRVPELLGAAGLTVEIHIDDRPVASIGPPGSGGFLAGLVGFDGLSIRPGAAVLAVLGR